MRKKVPACLNECVCELMMSCNPGEVQADKLKVANQGRSCSTNSMHYSSYINHPSDTPLNNNRINPLPRRIKIILIVLKKHSASNIEGTKETMKFLTELLVAATFFTTTSGFSLSNVHATSTGSSASSKVNTKYKSLM